MHGICWQGVKAISDMDALALLSLDRAVKCKWLEEYSEISVNAAKSLEAIGQARQIRILQLEFANVGLFH